MCKGAFYNDLYVLCAPFSFSVCPPECATTSCSVTHVLISQDTPQIPLFFWSPPPTPPNSYRHNYTRMRSTCCASTASGAINASSPSCAVRGGEAEERMWQKSPFMFVEEEERAVIKTLEAPHRDFSPLCVHLCIHQVFRRRPLKRPHSSCLHLSANTTDTPRRELAIYAPHNAPTIASCECDGAEMC